MAMPEGDPDVAVDKSSFAPKRGQGHPCKSYADAAAAPVPTVVDNAPPLQAVVPPPPPIISSDLGMTLCSGRSYQPAVAGGGNPTVSADVQVSVINMDDEWVTVIHSNKNKKKSQWGKWSKLEHRNFAQFGDTYKTVLCKHEDPVQVQELLPNQLYHRMWQFLIRMLAILTSIREIRVHRERTLTTAIQINLAHCHHCQRTQSSIIIQRKEVQTLQVSQRSLNELLIGQTTKIEL